MEGRVLICTQDPELYLLLNHILAADGFFCLLADSGADVESHLQEGGLLAVIFDGAAWHGDIVALCRLAKQAGLSVGALIGGDMQATHLQMIKAGIDDGIMRPLAPGRLLAFLRRAMKSAGNPSLRAEAPPDLPADFPFLTESDHVLINGRRLTVTPIEKRILETLIRNRSGTCSRKQLLSAVWPHSQDIGIRTVDVHIARLRKALSTCTEVRIKTIYGEGYALVSPMKGDRLSGENGRCQPYKG